MALHNRTGNYLKEMEEEQGYLWALMDALGLGLEPTLQYLIGNAPEFEEFEDWIASHGSASNKHIELFNDLLLNPDNSAPTPKVISSDMQRQWEEDGYVIIPEAISKKDAAKTAALIFDHLSADPQSQDTWYKDDGMHSQIMLQIFKDELLQKNRFNARVQAAFQEIWGRKDLMASCDRVSFNPPETEQFKFAGPHLHWDVSLQQPIPFGTQGMIYLTDTTEDQGAFKLVPGFHKKIGKWLDSLSPEENPRTMDLEVLNPKKVAAKAGDLIIWHQALPHGASANTSDKPRLVQYINYLPLDREIKAWK